jgi:hypothetical protein
MMRILAIAMAAGALLGATQALATDEPNPAASAPPPSAMPTHTSRYDPNEVICKREQSSESRLGGAKICHTRQEWTDISSAARTSVDNMQRSANFTSPH